MIDNEMIQDATKMIKSNNKPNKGTSICNDLPVNR